MAISSTPTTNFGGGYVNPFGTNYGNRYDPAQNFGVGGFPAAVSNSLDDSGTIPAADDSNNYLGGYPAATGDIQEQPALEPQAKNASQRWQSNKPQSQTGMRTSSDARRFFNYTGLVDARAPQAETHSGLNYDDRGAKGITPQADWENQFKPQIDIPRASNDPNAGTPDNYSWSNWYPKAGGNPQTEETPHSI